MSEANEEPEPGGRPDPATPGTGGGVPARQDGGWFGAAPRAGERDERPKTAGWFSQPGLSPLREVTAPTETNASEQVAPPAVTFEANAGADSGSDPPSGHPHPRGRGGHGTDSEEAAPGGTGGGQSGSGAGGPHTPAGRPARAGEAGPVTPLWPHIDEEAEDPGSAEAQRRQPRGGGRRRPPAFAPPAGPGGAPQWGYPPPGAQPPAAHGSYPASGSPGSYPASGPPGYYHAPGHPPAQPPGAVPPHGAPVPPPGAHAEPGGAAPSGPSPASGVPGAAPYLGGYVRFLPPPSGGGAWAQPPPPPPAPVPETDVTRGRHRLHWSTVPFQVLLITVVFLALPGPLLLQTGPGWFFMLTVAVAFGTAAYALMSWWKSSFELSEDHLIVHTGLVRQLSREIPLSRLQAVDVVRPLLMQILGLAELRVELAGGDSSEIRLGYLTRGTAERLRASLLAHAAGLSGKTPEAPEWPFYRLPFGLLLGALAFRVPVLGAFLLFLLLIVTGIAFFEFGVLGGAVPLLLGLMRGFLGPLMRYTDFYASLSPDGLRLRYGIFQARMQTVPPGRVQAARIVEPVLWRALGVARVEANVAGYVGERQMDSSTLLPVAPRRLAFSLVNELFPGTDVSRVPLHPAEHGRSGGSWLGVDETLIVTRRGFFCHVTEILPEARVQSVRLTAGPVNRWRGTATVHVDTPPGPIRAHAPGRGLAEARRVVDGIAERGHAARMANAGPERWATRSEGPEGPT